MAIYYLNAQIIGRSAGRTATGAAAYRAGERIHDERTGLTFDYTRRRGGIETEIMAPTGAPAWMHERQQLWNAVERAEKRSDAQVAREIVVALPVELTKDQQWGLLREFVQEQFVSRGMVADVALHRNPGNPHAHIMLTMREAEPTGLAPTKNRDWNRPEMLDQWRKRWAANANRALERAERAERIDHRSLTEQGLDRLPQVHLGPIAAALERLGVPTEKGDHNRLVAEHNAVVIDLEKARAEKKALKVERALEDRQTSRIEAGWLPQQAKAMSVLEAENPGKPLTYEDLHSEHSRLWQEHRNILTGIRGLEDQERRLRSVSYALKQYSEASRDLKRHLSPFAAIRRLFSPMARMEHQVARDRVAHAEASMQREGVSSGADLKAHQAAWELQQPRLMQLTAKAEGIVGRMNLINDALNGFRFEMDRLRQKHERERASQERLEHRQKAREVDRGR